MFSSFNKNRKTIRYGSFDYSQNGHYFVTVCTYKQEHLFGEIINDDMILNQYGRIVNFELLKTNNIRPDVYVDEFVIMPNHIHVIVKIDKETNETASVGAYSYTPLQNTPIQNTQKCQFKSPSKNLGAMVRGFKTVTTIAINKLRNVFKQPVWQRNYYEHIIRDDVSLYNIRQYIQNNPKMWYRDRNNN